jgi:hypothetical protein
MYDPRGLMSCLELAKRVSRQDKVVDFKARCLRFTRAFIAAMIIFRTITNQAAISISPCQTFFPAEDENLLICENAFPHLDILKSIKII